MARSVFRFAAPTSCIARQCFAGSPGSAQQMYGTGPDERSLNGVKAPRIR